MAKKQMFKGKVLVTIRPEGSVSFGNGVEGNVKTRTGIFGGCKTNTPINEVLSKKSLKGYIYNEHHRIILVPSHF